MDVAAVLADLNAGDDETWESLGTLPGGSSGGAVELLSGTRRGVLKAINTSSPDVVAEMAAVVAAALARGWPAARWLRWGVAGASGYVVLEWCSGEPAQSLTPAERDVLVSAVARQAGLGAGLSRLFDWSARFSAIVAEDSGHHRRARRFSARTGELSHRLAAACRPFTEPMPTDDLVHGDFASDNVLVDGTSVAIIDTQAVGRGTRLIDLATAGVHCIAWEQGEQIARHFLDACLDHGPGDAIRCAAGRALIAVVHSIEHYPHYADVLATRLLVVPGFW